MKPNFFIIGAPKAGTTAMHTYLSGHPNVFMSTPKEPHFYDDDYSGMPGVDTRDEYDKLFTQVLPYHEVIGEASATYLTSKFALRHICREYPNARLLIILRNPVEAAYSLHSQLLFPSWEDKPFEIAWCLQNERRLGRKLPPYCPNANLLQYQEIYTYSPQIERALRYFSPERIKLVFYDDLVRDTGRVYRDVLRFLKLSDDGRTDFSRVNENTLCRAVWLAKFINHPPELLNSCVRFVKTHTGISNLGIGPLLRKASFKVAPRPPLQFDLRNQIADAFAGDIDRLADLVGRDLSAWKNGGLITESRSTMKSQTDVIFA